MSKWESHALSNLCTGVSFLAAFLSSTVYSGSFPRVPGIGYAPQLNDLYGVKLGNGL